MTDDTEPRAPGCLCTHEQGDSDCPIHAMCPDCGESQEGTALFRDRKRLHAQLAAVTAERDEAVGMMQAAVDACVEVYERKLRAAAHPADVAQLTARRDTAIAERDALRLGLEGMRRDFKAFNGVVARIDDIIGKEDK